MILISYARLVIILSGRTSVIAAKRLEQEQAARSLAERKFSDLATRVCHYFCSCEPGKMADW